MSLNQINGQEEPGFHSYLISHHLDQVGQAHQEYNTSLDEISNDIRSVEAVLKEKKITIPYSHLIAHNTTAGVYALACLKWENYQERGYRLLYYSEIGGGNDEPQVECKPLIETSAGTRIHAYPHISNFLAAFSEHLREAKSVREKVIESDAMAALGML